MYPLFTKRITIYAVNPETARQTAVYNKPDDTYCFKACRGSIWCQRPHHSRNGQMFQIW